MENIILKNDTRRNLGLQLTLLSLSIIFSMNRLVAWSIKCWPQQWKAMEKSQTSVFQKVGTEGNVVVHLRHWEMGWIFHCCQIGRLSWCTFIYSTPVANVTNCTTHFIPPLAAVLIYSWNKGSAINGQRRVWNYHKITTDLATKSLLHHLTTCLGFWVVIVPQSFTKALILFLSKDPVSQAVMLFTGFNWAYHFRLNTWQSVLIQRSIEGR